MPKSYFPPKSLKDALRIPTAIFEKNAGKPMFRLTLATELKLKPEATAFRNLITASAGYGLTSGSYIAEKIELEQRGNDLVCGNMETAYEALFSVEVFKQFYDYFGTSGSKGIPSEKAANDFLKDECGVPSKQVNKCLSGILENARDWHLIQDYSGTERFVPRELAMQVTRESSAPSSPETVLPPSQAPKIEAPESPVEQDTPPAKVAPQLQLNIEIHIAADTPDDKIETIFKNMKKYLLTND